MRYDYKRLTLATSLAREFTLNQSRNSTPNSHWVFNIKYTRAKTNPKVSKCAFKTKPMKEKLWSFIARLLQSSPRCQPVMQTWDTAGPIPFHPITVQTVACLHSPECRHCHSCCTGTQQEKE